MAFKIGKSGTAEFGVTTMKITKWTLKDSNDLQDSTTASSAGSIERIPGYKDWSADIEGYLDFAALETDMIAAGAAVELTLNLADSAYAYTGDGYVKECTIENVAKSIVSYKVTVEGNGALTRPDLTP